MKESSTSLRAYFGVIGFFYLFSIGAVSVLTSALGLGAILLNSPAAIVNTIIGALEAIGFIYFAITLPQFLNADKVKYLFWFLYANFGVAVLGALIAYVATGTLQYIGLGFSALITWYLYRNVSRMALPPTAPGR